MRVSRTVVPTSVSARVLRSTLQDDNRGRQTQTEENKIEREVGIEHKHNFKHGEVEQGTKRKHGNEQPLLRVHAASDQLGQCTEVHDHRDDYGPAFDTEVFGTVPPGHIHGYMLGRGSDVGSESENESKSNKLANDFAASTTTGDSVESGHRTDAESGLRYDVLTADETNVGSEGQTAVKADELLSDKLFQCDAGPGTSTVALTAAELHHRHLAAGAQLKRELVTLRAATARSNAMAAKRSHELQQTQRQVSALLAEMVW